MDQRETEHCEREISRLARRAHWQRVGTVAGLLLSGAFALWALVEVVVMVAFYLGGRS